jgi:hypothetical protein
VRASRLQWLVVLLTIASGSAACAMLSGLKDYSAGLVLDDGGKPAPEKETGVEPLDANDQETGSTGDEDAESGGPSTGDASDGSGDDAADGAQGAGDADGATETDDGGPADAGEGAEGGPGEEAGASDGGCRIPLLHMNGLGQNYFDCAPLMTYNETQAQKACASSTGDASACTANTMACQFVGGETLVCSNSCECWAYSGSVAGRANNGGLGHLCSCPATIDPSWN